MNRLKSNTLKVNVNYKQLAKRNNKQESRSVNTKDETIDAGVSAIKMRMLEQISQYDLFPMEQTQKSLAPTASNYSTNTERDLNVRQKQNIPKNIKQRIRGAEQQKQKVKTETKNKKNLTQLPDAVVNTNVIKKITKPQLPNRKTNKKIDQKTDRKTDRKKRHHHRRKKINKKSSVNEKDLTQQKVNTKKIKHAYRITKNIITKEKLPNPFRNEEKLKNTTLTLDQVFDKIFIFNLAKDTEKKNNMVRRLAELGLKKEKGKYEFFEAVNGYQKKEMIKREKFLAKKEHSQKGVLFTKEKRLLKNPGAWGYNQGYIQILEKVIENKKINRILLFDDDVLFDSDFVNKFDKTIKHLPEKFEIIWLGTSQRKWHYTTLPTKKSGRTYYSVGFDQIRGSFSLGLDRTVFKPLLEELKKCRAPVDNAFDVLPFNPNRCYIIYPNICIADLRTGTINGERSMKLGRKKFKWKLENFNLETIVDD